MLQMDAAYPQMWENSILQMRDRMRDRMRKHAVFPPCGAHQKSDNTWKSNRIFFVMDGNSMLDRLRGHAVFAAPIRQPICSYAPRW